MTATIIRPAVWAKALPQLPKAASKPDAPAIVRYVGDWLAVLEADPSRGPEFDRDLDLYAATLRQSGALTPHQGAGFLLALWAYQNVGNPLTATLVAQVDRRAALRGVRHCKWRGTIPEREYDSWRYDEALRRVQLPHKWERGE
jgi:hypothetical protein